ncbi:uncharacterized protein LTR77_010132 [Saxophila tyrrhenica]|uniref:Uncharacterized protein n=1 Tax=Saxophila tyrrhenica TaxID=1690608 RepID=A0AAV9NVX5_9PEZI|nr:hypothetical protein LTR77_010132 [Saxophila tyrrhenica]
MPARVPRLSLHKTKLQQGQQKTIGRPQQHITLKRLILLSAATLTRQTYTSAINDSAATPRLLARQWTNSSRTAITSASATSTTCLDVTLTSPIFTFPTHTPTGFPSTVDLDFAFNADYVALVFPTPSAAADIINTVYGQVRGAACD